MCLQDVKLGQRRYWRITPVGIATKSFPGDQRRVGVRISVTPTVAAENVGQLSWTDVAVATPQMFVNAGSPIDEMWLDRHGSIVTQPFTVTSGGNLVVCEFLDNDPDAPTDSGY